MLAGNTLTVDQHTGMYRPVLMPGRQITNGALSQFLYDMGFKHVVKWLQLHYLNATKLLG